MSCCPFACLCLSASASASRCAPPFVGCCKASFGPSQLLHPSFVVFSSSFLPLEFPFIVIITVVIHHPPPVHCRHLSPPSAVQQYLIVVSSLSVVHHIIFIVIIMLHIVIIASSSCPLLLLTRSQRPLIDTGRFVVGKKTNDWCPPPPISCRRLQTFPFFSPHRPCPQQAPPRLRVDVGRRGTWAKVSHALFVCYHRGRPSSIVPVISIHRQSSTVHRRIVNPSATSPPQRCCHLQLERLIAVYID